MSWAAHDLEPYAFQKHLGGRVAIIPLIIGSYSPDLVTKWFVYGVTIFGIKLKAHDTVDFHRGWPGAGFTHSLAFGALIALVLTLSGKRVWAFSFLLGHWAHALSDVGDTQGTMLFFPLTTQRISLDAWAYAGHTGRFDDAGAYFSGLGFVWDGIWIAYGIVNWRILRLSYFRDVVVPADGIWTWAGQYLPERALVTIYRASLFYGTSRWVAWLIWAHVVHDYAFDITWGGPHWVVPDTG